VDGVPLSFSLPADSSLRWPWESLKDDLYIANSTEEGQAAEAIILWTSIPDSLYARPCLLSPSAGSSAAELADAVAMAPGVELVSGPSDVTVGGRAAKHVVLSVVPDAMSMEVSDGAFRTAVGQPLLLLRLGGLDAGRSAGHGPGDTIRSGWVEVDGRLLFIKRRPHGRRPGGRAGSTDRRLITSVTLASRGFRQGSPGVTIGRSANGIAMAIAIGLSACALTVAAAQEEDVAGSPPVEFTGHIECGPEVRHGIDSSETLQVGDDQVRHSGSHGYAWQPIATMSDPRMEGTYNLSFEWDEYLPPGAAGYVRIGAGTWRIENEEGAWQGSHTSAYLSDSADTAASTVLSGEGAYEGLSVLWQEQADWDACTWDVRGLIIEGGAPAVPEVYIPE
jgi:hypothetical protein